MSEQNYARRKTVGFAACAALLAVMVALGIICTAPKGIIGHPLGMIGFVPGCRNILRRTISSKTKGRRPLPLRDNRSFVELNFGKVMCWDFPSCLGMCP